MRVPPGLLTADDFNSAIMDEPWAIRALMPDDPIAWGLQTIDGAAGWALRQCSGEFFPVVEQIVTVRKSRHGVRPVAELSMRDRLLYRALVDRWKSALAPVDRSGAAFDKFQRAPLEDPWTTYVVTSDITAYYQYIDHGLLARELVTRTGDSEGIDALTALLGGITGRSFGLPQQSEPSDLLAETYLSVVHRRLVRQGLSIWRYNDDFRVAATSWPAALDAVDRLEREARRLGLALNDSKTVIRRRETYKSWLSRHDKAVEEISAEVKVDLSGWLTSPYDEIQVDPDEDEVRVEAARRIVERWHNNRLDEDKEHLPEHREEGIVLTELLRRSLPMLTGTTDADVLQWCGLMLRTEQSMTPTVARYLQKFAEDEAAALVDWFEDFLADEPYLTPWQAWWIGPAVGAAEGAFAGRSKQRAWLEGVWDDHTCPEPVRAGLAYALAKAGVVTADVLLRAYDAMTDTGRPAIARALGVLVSETHAGAATVIAEDELSRWAFAMGAGT